MGNRVYSSDGIAVTVCANPVGNLGGFTSLYLVKESRSHEQQKDGRKQIW